MLLRVQTPKGQKRYNCGAGDTLLSLKQKVHADTGIPVEELELALRDDQAGTTSNPLVNSNAKTLEQCGLKRGDLLMVVASAEVMHKKEEEKPQGKMIVNKYGELIREEIAPIVDVKEDPIDQIISKEDGWVYKKQGLRSSTKKMEDYIAPWDIENHEPWKSMELGHIPFHSWSRQSQSGLTEEVTIKRPNIGEKNWEALTRTVKIQRQLYRHVDHVTFEHASVGNAFIQAYVKSGAQQYGFLLGNHVKNPDIPLGITCLISAIYTPLTWNPVAVEEVAHVESFAAKFGLTVVGWIWTALGPKATEGRSPGLHLKVNEMHHMAKFQKSHPNPWCRSNTGQFGSKFLSVVALDNEEGNPHFRSFQLSNQAVALLNDEIIKVSKKKQTKFLLSKSNEKWQIPDLIYFQTKGDEGARITTEKKVERYLDEDILPYFIVNQPVTFPVNPNPLFTNFKFPTLSYNDKRQGARWSHVEDQLKAAAGPKIDECWSILNDFHFLIWLDHQIQKESDEIKSKWTDLLLPTFIKAKDPMSANEVIKFVRELLKKSGQAPAASVPATKTETPNAAKEKTAPQLKVNPEVKWKNELAQLRDMGFEQTDLLISLLESKKGNVEEVIETLT